MSNNEYFKPILYIPYSPLVATSVERWQYFLASKISQSAYIRPRKQKCFILVFGEQSAQWSFSESAVAETQIKFILASVFN